MFYCYRCFRLNGFEQFCSVLCIKKKRWITKLRHVWFFLDTIIEPVTEAVLDVQNARHIKMTRTSKTKLKSKQNLNNNKNHKVWECVFIMYLRFSELNSDSRNLRNCSLPTGSFKTSSMPNAHLFTLCWPGSLLQDKSCAVKAACIITLK